MSFEKLSLSQKFVVLALAADDYLEDCAVVFHYFGPVKLREYAKEMKGCGLREIISHLQRLEEQAQVELNDSFPLFRRTHLITQTRSVRGLLAFRNADLSGEELLAGVSTILGVRPPEPFDIAEIRKEFKADLSKYGYSSYEEFKQDTKIFNGQEEEVSDKYILNLIEALKESVAEELLPKLFGGSRLTPILKASKIKIVKPSKKRPPCYYAYKGGYEGEFCLSPHHRKDKFTVIRTVMHELLPGHHLQSLYREMLYTAGYLKEEATIDLLYGAETTLNEGIAEIVPTTLFDSFGGSVKSALEIMTSAEHYCKKVLYNVWFKMFVSKTMNEEGAADYIKDIGELDDEKIPMWLDFIKDWKIYYPSYPAGIAMVKEFLDTTGSDGLEHLYIPKTPSILLKLKEERRIYEEDSRKTVLCNADIMY